MIYTKTGDKGTTSLAGGTRVPKYDLRVECYGTIDELVSYLGLVRDCFKSERLTNEMVKIQRILFNAESILSSESEEIANKMPQVTEADVAFLERRIDAMNQELTPLKAFLIPGGSRTSSHIHVARCVCRRAERLCARLNEEQAVNSNVLMYLNRLSDYLFVLARYILKEKKRKETYWQAE
jgi:cob(I)alamin adenosyltransferase